VATAWRQLRVVWSAAAAARAVRAAVVMPALFALAYQVIGNLQVATFAAFGSFATLVLANFGGHRRDKLIAHAGLAVAGSVLVVVGTAVSATTALAVSLTVPVTFAVFFSGVVGPNAASGVTAALLAYVLPAASAGTISMVPDRLAGWWLASVAGTLAVLGFPGPVGGDALRAALADLAGALADELDALLSGEVVQDRLERCIAAKHALLAQFNSTPYRPTGLTSSDQATANAVEVLEWCTSLVIDTAHEQGTLICEAKTQRELLQGSTRVLRDCAALFAAGTRWPDLDGLDRLRHQDAEWLAGASLPQGQFGQAARVSFHAGAIAVAVLAFGADTVVAARLAGADWMADARSRWFGDSAAGPVERTATGLRKYLGVAAHHAGLRSTWFINSLRGALALAAAIAVADLGSVQHGFWVVLAALSVLRTNAASTGANVLRALAGTAVGFGIGSSLLLAIGTGSAALWAALPVAVLVAAYAPGTAPLAVGQAAFTVTVAVLFNLLAPAGWQVGVVRIEDVAIGCVVSVLVGGLFWPRGMAAVVGDDLADAYRSGAAYFSHAVGWVCGRRPDPPDERMAAIAAGLRLDEALRAFLAEQGTKHLAKEELWRLVGGTLRLRLTAHAVARLPHQPEAEVEASEVGRRADQLVGFYEQLAGQLDRPRGRPIAALQPPSFDGVAGPQPGLSRQSIWLREHLEHLREHLPDLVQPAAEVAALRRRPWWR
jgi:hypothetical protein